MRPPTKPRTGDLRERWSSSSERRLKSASGGARKVLHLPGTRRPEVPLLVYLLSNGDHGLNFDKVTNHVVHVVPVAPEPTPSPGSGPTPHPPPRSAPATAGEPLAGPSSTFGVKTVSVAGAPSGANRGGDAFPTDSSGNVSSSETLGGESVGGSPVAIRPGTPHLPPLAGLRPLTCRPALPDKEAAPAALWRSLSQQSCREAFAAPTRPLGRWLEGLVHRF
jgi:hypothetical protein